MSFTESDCRYMRRALQLAAGGRGHVSPNPMVGAVIVAPDGRIIGEGWHRRYGGPHAEVNAVRSVSPDDTHLLPQSTIYVTLEPCSHYGKTPPCAKLLIDIGIGRVIVGADDPNPRVSGRGIAMLRDAGIEVHTGLMAKESWLLNKTFMTAHTYHRPFVTLKWAQSADGYMNIARTADGAAARFSTAITSVLVHSRRAVHDGIAVGGRTALLDRPRLDTRLVAGKSPQRVVFDRHGIVAEDDPYLHINGDASLAETLHRLYAEHNMTSLLVEGGPSLLGEFIAAGLWDEAYVEVAPIKLDKQGRAPAPVLAAIPDEMACYDANKVIKYSNFAQKHY